MARARDIAVIAGAAIGGRALYLFFTGQSVSLKSIFFLEDGSQPNYGYSSFTPYAPGATRVGPLAPVSRPPLPLMPNIATNVGSDVTIAPGDED